MSVRDREDSVQLRDEAIGKMELAIQLLPEVRKSAYLEAVQRVPHLVETESPPIWFLRFTGYENAGEAAARLCCYWEFRKEIFVERAFLPLNQTGDGALDKDDIFHLDLGSFAFLPKCVVFHDPSKYAEICEQGKLRLLFYLWSILSENEEIQKHGYVVLVPLFSTRCGANFRVFEEVVLRAMPVRIKRAYLLLCCPTQAEMWTFYAEFLPKALRELVDLKEIIHVAAANNLRDFAKELASHHGLPESGLPDVLGGTWNLHQSFLLWRGERLVLERGRYNKNIVPLEAGISREEQTSTSTASAVQHSKHGTSLSNWKKPKSVPTTTTVSASFTPENYPTKSTLSLSRSVSTSKPYPPSVKEGEPARAKHLGNAREKSNDAVEENPVMLDLQRELEAAILGIPREDRQAYTEALERVPHLVQNEPGPLCFLRAENFDAKAAALRAVTFWTLRKDAFGDRAFLPMDQTGDGALSRKDLELLATGALMHSGRDSQGRSILVATRSRMAGQKNSETVEQLKRIFFYFACVACEDNEVTQKHGLVMLRVVDPLIYRANLPLIYRANLKVLVQMSSCCGPFTIHAVVQGHLESGIINKIPGPNVLGDGNVRENYIHTGESVGEVVAKLRSHGIPEASLPPSLGGPWTVEKVQCWCRERVDYERKRANDGFSVSTHAADASPQESRLRTAQSDAVIGYDSLKASSARTASSKEQKLTADSRRRMRETVEDLPLQGFDGKRSRRSGEGDA